MFKFDKYKFTKFNFIFNSNYEKMLDFILSLFFPKRCIFCRDIMDMDTQICICTECEKEIAWISGTVCEKCGMPIDHYGLCTSCNGGKHIFDTAFAVYSYEGKVRSAIHRFKYSGKAGYAKYFGYEMARFADYNDVPFVDFVVPVPIHKKRLLDRGYNQCELLAMVFATERNEVCVNLLERVKHTRPQSGLNKSRREQNIKGAFDISDIGVDIKGKDIMLIDDIFTTGSTMDECARVLKKHGAAHIYAMCLSIRVQE